MENINEKQIMASPQKVQTMKFAFNIITIILIIGFLSSLLIPPQKRKQKPTLVGVTSHI
jgi:preprotein translocase subunit YajC